MTREQIIEEIWRLSTYDVFRVAMADDWILFVKLWPIWVVLLLVFVGVFLYELGRARYCRALYGKKESNL